MKKIFTTMMLLSAMLLATPAQAQRVSFGLKGGFNITNMSFSEEVFSSSNKYGFFVGPSVKVGLMGGLGADAAVFYDQREAEIEETKVKQQSINIPVNVRYNIGLGGQGGIYVAAGPQVSFAVGDKDFTINTVKSGEAKNTVKGYRLRDSNFSINLGAGAYLSKHIEVGFTYNIAIGKTGEVDYSAKGLYNEATKSHANAWQISAAFYL